MANYDDDDDEDQSPFPRHSHPISSDVTVRSLLVFIFKQSEPANVNVCSTVAAVACILPILLPVFLVLLELPQVVVVVMAVVAAARDTPGRLAHSLLPLPPLHNCAAEGDTLPRPTSLQEIEACLCPWCICVRKKASTKHTK